MLKYAVWGPSFLKRICKFSLLLAFMFVLYTFWSKDLYDKLLIEKDVLRSVTIDYKQVSSASGANKSPATQATTYSPTTHESLPKQLSSKSVHRRPPVLLVTYLRSGSSFTADMIQQSREVFYLFEPIRAFHGRYYYTQTKVCEDNENECRNPSGKADDPSYVVRNIINLLTCDLLNVHPRVLWLMRHKNIMSTEQNEYATCSRQRQSKDCLQRFQESCANKVVLIKTIRLSMDVVALLLKLIPDLKVIHLLRDPRGIINSRIRGRFLLDKNEDLYINATCSRMLKDIQWNYHLKHTYPGQVKTILYEALSEQPIEALYALHRVTNTTVTPAMVEYIRNHTMAGMKPNGYYRTIRGDSKSTAHNWRHRLKWETVKKIDTLCKTLYEHIGLLPLENVLQLRNLTFPSRQSHSPLFDVL